MKASRILTLLILIATATAQAQGPLTPPPGAPAPVMKSLDQVEARIPLVAGQPGVSVNEAGTIIISQPGSYYLTSDVKIATTHAHGIFIDYAVKDVTIDLNGYTLFCSGVSGGTAVRVLGRNIRILNGLIDGGTSTAANAGWEYGIRGGTDQGYDSIQVNDIYVRGTRKNAIDINWYTIEAGGPTGTVSRCIVTSAGGYGIIARMVSDCTVISKGPGIFSFGGVVSNCQATSQNDQGILSLNGGSVISSSGASTSGAGIVSDTVADSTGNSNTSVGIFAKCVSNSVGKSTSGAGIQATVATNCVGESSSGTFGMQVTGTASFCRGTRIGGTAIQAAIAIGCTSGGGTISSAQKHLGTP